MKACPGINVSEDSFVRVWESLRPGNDNLAKDVLLAAGIARGDTGAIRWLQQQIQGALAQMRKIPQHLFADIESNVLELIAVGSASRSAQIHKYAARGALAGWVQVVVARTAREVATRAGQWSDLEVDEAILSELAMSEPSPEVAALRNRFSGFLGPALASATARLSARERTLLKLHYIQGVGLEDIGRAYQVHRATVSRWLLSARQSFADFTRDELSSRANVQRSEVDSLVRALHSQLDISLRRAMDQSIE